MEKSKTLQEIEMAALADADSRTSELIGRQNATSQDCKDLVKSLEVQIAKVGESSRDLEQRAAPVTVGQQVGSESI